MIECQKPIDLFEKSVKNKSIDLFDADSMAVKKVYLFEQDYGFLKLFSCFLVAFLL